MELIPNGRPSIEDEDVTAVSMVLQSGWLTTGPKVKEFEEEFATYVGSKYAVAVSSGTAALELALTALDLPKEAEVITTPFTFVATSNAILYNSLKPVFVDIEPTTFNIDADKIISALTPRTRAILYVDYAGQPCNFSRLREIATEKNLLLIEDASHALGAEYRGKKVGSLAHLTTFSFHPVKNITTGEGGMITTNDESMYKKLLLLRNHGLDKSDQRFGGEWSYDLKLLGRNYRLTDFQCALGLSQLHRLAAMNRKRAEIARRYIRELSAVPEITFPKISTDGVHAWHLCVLLLNNIDRNLFYKELKLQGVQGNVHYIPIYKFEYYQKLGLCDPTAFPVTEDIFQKIITLPLYPDLTEKEVDYILQTVKETITKLKKSGERTKL